MDVSFEEISVFKELINGEVYRFYCFVENTTPIQAIELDFQYDYELRRYYKRYNMEQYGTNYYDIDVEVPYLCTKLSYWLNATGTDGNFSLSEVITVPVRNDDPYIFYCDEWECRTDELHIQYFYINGPEGMGDVHLIINSQDKYWVEHKEEGYLVSKDGYQRRYEFEFFVPPDWVGVNQYCIEVDEVLNGTVNTHRSDVYDFRVNDATPPSFTDVKDHIFRTGEEFNITLTVKDNDRIAEYRWTGLPISSTSNVLLGRVEERGVYHVEVTAIDASGNGATTEFLVIIESPDDNREDPSLERLMTITIAVVLLFGVFQVILMLNLRKKK